MLHDKHIHIEGALILHPHGGRRYRRLGRAWLRCLMAARAQ